MATGSCLCGAVRFEVRRLSPIQLCHASRCQKATGSAFAPELAARREDFRWLAGEELVAVYEAPLLREPPPYRRAFCRRCGSPAPLLDPERPFVGLLAGLLDDDPGTRPFRHIFTGMHSPWHDLPDDGVPRFHAHAPEAERRLRPSGISAADKSK